MTEIAVHHPPPTFPALGPPQLSDTAFDLAVSILAAAWPREPWPPATLALYRALLGHLPDDVVTNATIHAAATCTFPPRPAELLARAHQLLAERGDGPPTLESAWISVITAIRRDSTTGMHPLAAQALGSIGGLRAIGLAPWATLDRYRTLFAQTYRILCGRHYLSLAGLTDDPLTADDPLEPVYLPDPKR